MKKYVLRMLPVAIIGIAFSVLWFSGCSIFKKNRTNVPASDSTYQSRDAKRGTAEPHRVKGHQYPPYTPVREEPNNDRPFKVPDGPIRGDNRPHNSKLEMKEIKLDSSGKPINPGGAAVTFIQVENEGTGNGVNITPDVRSSSSVNRYGDYVAIRRFNANGRWFSAAGYTTQNTAPPASTQYQDVHYILFGRDRKTGGGANDR